MKEYQACRKCGSCFLKNKKYFAIRKSTGKFLTICRSCNSVRNTCEKTKYKRKLEKKGFKYCTKCNYLKPINIDYFFFRKDRQVWNSECKLCENRRKNDWDIKKNGRVGIGLLTKEEKRLKRNAQERERRRTDKEYKLRYNVSNCINKALKRNGGNKNGFSILQFLPYTMLELKKYLESQFEDWMNWNNYGVYEDGKMKWHLDHIIPQSKLPYDSMNHPNFQKCWALENLRPLEAVVNMKKGNKLIY